MARLLDAVAMSIRIVIRLLLCVFATASVSVNAQVLPVREIAAPDWDRGGEDDLFGHALVADGAQLIVGIPGAPTAQAPGAGMVEIFSPAPSGWVLSQRLLPEQNDEDEKFGIALAQSADDLVVGSWDAGFGNGFVPGSAHVYRRVAGQWQSPLRLVGPGVDAGDGFGSTVAVAADWLAVAAPGYDDASGIRGAVFLYRRDGNGWSFAQRIEGSDTTRPSGFACSMAMSFDRLYIGDCLGDTSESDTGVVQVYRLDASSATAIGHIDAPDLESGDEFGHTITASADTVLIAATIGNVDPERSPRVYLFDRDTDNHVLVQQQPLSGRALSMQIVGQRALVAGPICASTTTPGRAISCVRRFDRSADIWTEAPSYLQQPEVGFNGFGWSLAADANAIHSGNPFRDVAAGPSSGAVSSFDAAMPDALPARLELPPGLWRFAYNTAIDGDLMVASDARLGTPDQFNEGTAWVLDIAGGDPQLLQRIDTPEPYTYEFFANGTAVAGDRIVLSAGRRVPGGSSLVLRTYQRDGNAVHFIDEFNVFSMPELEGVVLFNSVAMIGDRLALLGQVPTARGQSPRIAVLRRQGNTWVFEALLQPPAQDEQIAINFSRLSMHGERIALLRGEVRDPPLEPRGWIAFVYRRNGNVWTLEQSIRPELADPPATVLLDIAINGDELALSSGDTLQNILRTRVHSYRFDGNVWQARQLIEAPAGVSDFGRQVAIENGLLAVESFPLTAISDNFVTPLRLYRADADAWSEVAQLLPRLAPAGEGRLFEYGAPQFHDGRLFAAGRREGPGVTTHTHGVMFEFDALDPLFANGFD